MATRVMKLGQNGNSVDAKDGLLEIFDRAASFITFS